MWCNDTVVAYIGLHAVMYMTKCAQIAGQNGFVFPFLHWTEQVFKVTEVSS